LEMVTERYLLRSGVEWNARGEAIRGLAAMLDELVRGDIPAVGASTERNFRGPIQTIIPWAGNLYTDLLIERTREAMGPAFHGFWMLGGMAGGGMGFLFAADRKAEGQERLAEVMRSAKRELETSVPFAMEPVIYDFAINERGSVAELLAGPGALLPPEYYTF